MIVLKRLRLEDIKDEPTRNSLQWVKDCIDSLNRHLVDSNITLSTDTDSKWVSGDLKPIAFDLPEGWLVCNGQTIGGPKSGATSRANEDARSLFVKIWNSRDNVEAPIEDFLGNPTNRGTSADRDFNDRKRIPLFDLSSEAPNSESIWGIKL